MHDNERIKTTLSPMTQKSISTMLMNFISTIPNGEEIEIYFSQKEENGTSHICLDAICKSRTPDIEKTVTLTKKNLDVKVGKWNPDKSATKADKKAT